MKCPECDADQPDAAATCSNCGLNFEAWRQLNPDTPAKPAKENETASPEASDVPPPIKTPEPEPVSPAPEKASDQKPVEGKQVSEKKSLTLGWIVGGSAGSVLALGLMFWAMNRPSPPSSALPAVTGTAMASPSPVPMALTPTESPASTPQAQPTVTASPQDTEVQTMPTAPSLTPTAQVSVVDSPVPTGISTAESTPNKDSVEKVATTENPTKTPSTDHPGGTATVIPVSTDASIPTDRPTAYAHDLLESSEPVAKPSPPIAPSPTPSLP